MILKINLCQNMCLKICRTLSGEMLVADIKMRIMIGTDMHEQVKRVGTACVQVSRLDPCSCSLRQIYVPGQLMEYTINAIMCVRALNGFIDFSDPHSQFQENGMRRGHSDINVPESISAFTINSYISNFELFLQY